MGRERKTYTWAFKKTFIKIRHYYSCYIDLKKDKTNAEMPAKLLTMTYITYTEQCLQKRQNSATHLNKDVFWHRMLQLTDCATFYIDTFSNTAFIMVFCSEENKNFR